MRRLKKNPPVLVENSKKKDVRRKGRRAAKKSFCNENKERTLTKKETTKMYPSLDACLNLKMDSDDIYKYMGELKLSQYQLRQNRFPHDEGFKPQTQVEATNSNRKCVRCTTNFQILNGTYLSDTSCRYHPRKACFLDHHHLKMHPCCGASFGSEPCAVSTHHVTVQHRPRSLVKTSSRRHVKKELQNTIFALDCEMSYTTDGLEVVWAGLVNLNGVPVVNTFVKPHNAILDYNTMFSGVTKADVETTNLTIDDVRSILMSHIHEDSILIGHAINNDLAALGLIHNKVVDTSVLYADPVNPGKKPALKTLAARYLGITIQDSPSGHDCIDDARASLQLALRKIPAAVLRNVAPAQIGYFPSVKKPNDAQRRAMQPACERRPFAEMQLSTAGRGLATEKVCDAATLSHNNRRKPLSHMSAAHVDSTFRSPSNDIVPCNEVFATPSGFCVPYRSWLDGAVYFKYYIDKC